MASNDPPRVDIPYPSDEDAAAVQKTWLWAKTQASYVQESTRRSIDDFNIRRYVWRRYNPGWHNPTSQAESEWHPNAPAGFDAKIHLVHGDIPATSQQRHQSPPPRARPENFESTQLALPVKQLKDSVAVDMQPSGELRFPRVPPSEPHHVAFDQSSWPCFQHLTAGLERFYDEHDAGEVPSGLDAQAQDPPQVDMAEDTMVDQQSSKLDQRSALQAVRAHGTATAQVVGSEADQVQQASSLPCHELLIPALGHDKFSRRDDSRKSQLVGRHVDSLSSFPLDGTPTEKRNWFEERHVHVRCTPCQVRNLNCDHDVAHPDGGCSNCRATGAVCDIVRPRGRHTEVNCKYKPTCYYWHDYARNLARQLARHFGYDYHEPPQHRSLDQVPPQHPKQREDGTYRQMSPLDMMPQGFMLPASPRNLSGIKPNTLACPWMYQRWDPPFYQANQRQIEAFDQSRQAAERAGEAPPPAEATSLPTCRSAESVPAVPLAKQHNALPTTAAPSAPSQHIPSYARGGEHDGARTARSVTVLHQTRSNGVNRQRVSKAPKEGPKISKKFLTAVNRYIRG
ncbi:hypothetical protein M409DRAFT_27724 [Zasmidium cellare ATCC 36951]|uniref:Zn(2)-C6 fungal-type domain-containing protein n=1 Tax=Zasmidium cellare ATCC 36951 TaxID=1080233 RepID=A0A6A6C8L2_ZASCE|nr:uncharacterized protein M409DRAFT_27724 [Zasmidium cellare ATCC 36951]KAF2161999.1 hypothetical protein M409DRAFT_27724 [Zasmidium cellare ATCC 36951]